MKSVIRDAFLSFVSGLVLFSYSVASNAQTVSAAGAEEARADDGLVRVDPSVIEAAWVTEDFDLSAYTRMLLMPTAVQYRDVPDRPTNARSRAGTEEFPLNEELQEWFNALWREAVEARFDQETSVESFAGVDSNVLVVQAFLVDVTSRIPPITPGSGVTWVRDPWSAAIVLELRDAATGQLIARTIDQRHAQGLLDVGAVWRQTEGLVDRWAQVLLDRLDQLSDLGEWSNAPDWAR